MNPTVTTRTRRAGVAVWVFTVLAALTGLFAPAVSAAAGVGPETRVRAIDTPTAAPVAAVDLGSSTSVGVSGLPLRQVVSATGVATNPGDAERIRERLSQLQPGRSSRVSVVGNDAELASLFDELASGGRPLSRPTYDGDWFELPDCTEVGMRNSSRSGGRTIDIRFPDGSDWKVHIS